MYIYMVKLWYQLVVYGNVGKDIAFARSLFVLAALAAAVAFRRGKGSVKLALAGRSVASFSFS